MYCCFDTTSRKRISQLDGNKLYVTLFVKINYSHLSIVVATQWVANPVGQRRIIGTEIRPRSFDFIFAHIQRIRIVWYHVCGIRHFHLDNSSPFIRHHINICQACFFTSCNLSGCRINRGDGIIVRIIITYDSICNQPGVSRGDLFTKFKLNIVYQTIIGIPPPYNPSSSLNVAV